MADKKAPIIIKKKKGGGGGHGHHGGAWKVAYADFVTAMMAFFLVMWLMGSDEETKAAISHYFNHPSTPYKEGADPDSKAIHPMGEMVGEGDTVLSGMDGNNPDDLVPNPVRSKAQAKKYKEMAELINEVLEGKAFGFEVELEYLRFSIPEDNLFVSETSHLTAHGARVLEKVGRILNAFKGYLTITDFSDSLKLNGHKVSSLYEASIIKSVAVMDYLVARKKMSEDQIHPVGSAYPPEDMGASKSRTSRVSVGKKGKGRRVEFTLRTFKIDGR